MTRRFAYLSAALLLCLILTIVSASGAQARKAVPFFSSALSKETARAKVAIQASEYEVRGGDAFLGGKRVEGYLRFRALSLAYEQLLAKRSPIFGISGTDTSRLRKSTGDLAHARDEYARAQTNKEDAAAVREALYPIAFLEKVADLEDARRAFVASGSEQDARAYRSLLRETAAEGLESARALRSAVTERAGEKSFVFLGIGGAISKDSLLASLDALVLRFETIEREIGDRAQCLRGAIERCRENDVALSVPNESSREPARSFAHVPFASWTTGTVPAFVLLDESACVRTERAPYVFAFLSGSVASRAPFVFRGNIFYAPTADSEGETMKYLRETLGMKYSIVNPLEFYLCPEIGADLGVAAAVQAAADFASEHAGYATPSRGRLLAGPGSQETLARSYLRDAAQEVRGENDGSILADFEELLNLWKERAAKTDMLVSWIAEVNLQDIRLASQGVPYDLDARTLFLTRTAFPSLFLTQSDVREAPPVLVRDASREASLPEGITTYWRLIATEDPGRIRADTRAFLEFEGIRQREISP